MKPSELPSHVTCKKAMVYVRQSSAQQVQENLESQRRQYNLVELAKSYGFSEVEVIDEDLGLTASGKVERPGFNRLVSQLCAGEVGAVLCLEASRIARNGRDWHHLLELCGLANARVIDSDGVYNPSSPNDRLLLGMKGTISEFELGIIRTRMLEASWSKAQRGELRIAVPIGYVWHSEASVDFDPDLRIQEMIHLVFERFFILGSARKVLLSMKAEGLHFPRPSDGKLTTSFHWQPPNYRNIISILNNPFYAGVYAYGKSEVQTEIVDGYARRSYGRRKPMEEWKVFIKDHHKGYIIYDNFEEIQEKLAKNAFSKKDGKSKSGRGGRALLSGLLRCGICGRKLKVVYTGRYPGLPRYRCEGGNVSLGLPYCIVFGGTRVDRVIAHEILTVVQPMAIEAAMEVEKRKADSRKERRKIHELELEQARYNAQLAERRYAACDPSNRLVAAQLEARWEDAIQQVKSCELRLDKYDKEEPDDLNIEELSNLSEDLSLAWDAPSTTMQIKQRIVQTLIEEIIVGYDKDSSRLILTIHWRGGRHSELRVTKPKSGEHERRASKDAIKIIESMSGRYSNEEIAATLNRLGYKTGQAKTWNSRRVQSMRQLHSIRAYKSANKDGQWLTMSEAASYLGVSNHVIRRLIRDEVLPATQVVTHAPHQIRAEDLKSERVKRAVKNRNNRPCRHNRDGRNLVIPGT